MILSDIREPLDWTLNWTLRFLRWYCSHSTKWEPICSTQPINRDRWGPIMVFGNTTKGWDPYCHKHTWDLLPRTTGRKFQWKGWKDSWDFSLLIDRWVRQISVNFEKESYVWLASFMTLWTKGLKTKWTIFIKVQLVGGVCPIILWYTKG